MKKELIFNKSMPIITTISIIKRISVITTILIASIALTACTGKSISSEISDAQPPFQTTDQQSVAPLVGQPFTSPNPTTETIDTTDTSGTAAPSDTTDTSGTAAPSVASDYWMNPIEGLPEDFIMGMDASSVLAEENSGVKYYGYDQNEQDVFKTFAESGINYIRLRVWNDPYDENGNGYGGGNCDVETATELGKRATKYGMKVCVDFHYSDFWADPKRQHAPKAWEGLAVDEKAEELYVFTEESLAHMLDAGVNVGMVQIGNEINNGMCGEKKEENVITLLKTGSRAVRDISSQYGTKIDIVVHYTNIENKAEIDSRLSHLKDAGVDYDVLGLSFYPFWDGSFKNMKRVVELMGERYGVKVMLAETSYPCTLEEGDGTGNSFSNVNDLVKGYGATITGQGKMIHDIIEAVNEVNGIGIFYWEGAWIPVGPKNEDNSPIWEKYGSGWASSFAADYDPEDAGLYYGGCSWENQAMFDYEGYPRPSLMVFKYARG